MDIILNVDALEHLPTIKDETFDAVVTDPPFGIGFRYKGKDVANTAKDYEQFITYF